MSGNEPGNGSEDANAAPDGDLSARLRRLETQLERKRPSGAPGATLRPSASDGSSLGKAMRLSTEFVAGVIAGGILGWIFDRLLGTKPWGLIVFLMLGVVTGIYNVMRLSGFFEPTGEKDGRKGS